MNDQTTDQTTAAAAEAEAQAEEARFQRGASDPSTVQRAGIANGMHPDEVRRRILAVTPA